MKRVVTILKQKAYQHMKQIGCASGSGNRSRIFLSAKEKMNDPRRQRKQKDWD